MKVLIAEDNHDNRQLVSDILTSLGHTAILAIDGRSALEKALADPPDLAILDVNMPEMDGFELVAALKANPVTAEIPVIMLTAQADIDSRVTGLGLGADDYLAKPFHPRELIAHIETRLRTKGVADSLRQQRREIRQTFERFVAPAIVQQMLDDPTRVQLGGAERVVTVLFADLEGFTPIAEHSDPVQLVEVLNSYHTLLVHHIKANGGTVDKFLGDGIMALFNTPLEQDNHVLCAVKTALNVRAALPVLHETIAPLYRLHVNVGIHTGRAIVGNIGTPELMDYTAIGDTVNLASRLQGLSENSQITISEETYHLIADAVHATRVGPRMVRGREEPVITYRIDGLR